MIVYSRAKYERYDDCCLERKTSAANSHRKLRLTVTVTTAIDTVTLPPPPAYVHLTPACLPRPIQTSENNMEFKPDWGKAQAHFAAWWSGSYHERVTLGVTARREPVLPAPELPETLEERWLNPDYRIAQAEHVMSSTYYGGEAFPYFDTHVGPGSLALFLGCPGTLQETTVWYEPAGSTPADVLPLKFDPDNPWWIASRKLVEIGMERASGRYLVSFPDLIENFDIAASLIGAQDILYALIDDPEGVKEIIRQVNDLYFRYYDDLYDLLDGERLGSCFSAFQIWGQGRTAKVQCDAAAMISPATFSEFVAPWLAEQTAKLDYSVYHLDGPDAVCHIEELCRIPDLNAIQWTPGAGEPSVEHECWWPMYDKIRKLGKGLLLLGAEYSGVEALAKHLGPDGVYIGTQAPSVEAADDMLRKAYTW